MGTAVTGPPARIGLAVLALVVAAWLAVGLRSAIPETRAQRLTTQGNLTPAQEREARRLYVSAQSLTPDSRAQVSEGSLLFVAKRYRESAAVLEDVVGREPDNAPAWALLANATRPFDRARSAQALAQLRRLKPPVRQ